MIPVSGAKFSCPEFSEILLAKLATHRRFIRRCMVGVRVPLIRMFWVALNIKIKKN